MRFPDFYCIGIQKSGTSWLHENLKRHPDVFLPFLKEVQYFNHLYIPKHRAWTDRHRMDRMLKAKDFHLRMYREKGLSHHKKMVMYVESLEGNLVTDEWYAKIFSLAKNSQLCGEITPEYSLLPNEGVRHLLSLNPNTKIILMLRNPIERDFSHVRMILRNQGAIENVDINKGEDQDARILSILKNDVVWQRSEYENIISRWRGHIGEGDLFVALFDRISSEPYELMNEICDFLGVHYDEDLFPELSQVVHKGIDIKMSERVQKFLEDKHRNTIKYINDEFSPNW